MDLKPTAPYVLSLEPMDDDDLLLRRAMAPIYARLECSSDAEGTCLRLEKAIVEELPRLVFVADGLAGTDAVETVARVRLAVLGAHCGIVHLRSSEFHEPASDADEQPVKPIGFEAHRELIREAALRWLA